MRSFHSIKTVRRVILVVFASAATLIGAAGESQATYHAYRISEVYSNPTGTIQFIELHEVFGSNGQNLLSEAPDIKSTTHDFVFLTDLPSDVTAHTSVLLGTAGYNALTGAPHSDYQIPNNFFNPLGDTLQYGSTGPDLIVDKTTFPALPTVSTEALLRSELVGNDFTIGRAIATSFSNGGNFFVPEPSTLALAALGLAGFVAWRGRRGRNGSAI